MDAPLGLSTHPHAVRTAIILAAALALFVTGCGVTATRQPGAATTSTAGSTTMNSVHVLRTSAFPENHIPPLDETVNHFMKVQRLYDALHALPPFPHGTFNCPADFGEAYHLTFFRSQTQASWATVKPDGCRGVTLPNGDIRWSATTDSFWLVFADTLGVPEPDLFPTPAATGPFAPTPVPGQQ